MKKYLIFIYLITQVFSLSANVLKDVYHRDYGVIDRTVLVFEAEPKLEISHDTQNIFVEISNCQNEAIIVDSLFTENGVLDFIDFAINIDKLVVFLQPKDNFTFESHSFSDGDYFKLYFDIFLTENPQTVSEIESFIAYYKQIEKLDLAESLVEKFAKAKLLEETNIKPQTTLLAPQTEDKEEINEKVAALNFVQTTKLKIKKHYLYLKGLSRKNQLIGLGLSGLFILVLCLIFYRRKPQSLRPQDGFGNEQFQIETIKKLTKEGWQNQEIARELNLPDKKIVELTKDSDKAK